MADKRVDGKSALWNQLLRVVRGESTVQLVEQFTQEMTLVAEGLCEDQARLRRAMDGLDRREQDVHERSEKAIEALSELVRRQGQEQSAQLAELSRRILMLEQQAVRSRMGLWRRLTGRDMRLQGIVPLIGAALLIAVVMKLLG